MDRGSIPNVLTGGAGSVGLGRAIGESFPNAFHCFRDVKRRSRQRDKFHPGVFSFDCDKSAPRSAAQLFAGAKSTTCYRITYPLGSTNTARVLGLHRGQVCFTVAGMRPLRALTIYILAVFLGGALLAPWLFWLAQAVIPSLANSPFHRFVDRSLLGIALIGLWPLLRSLGATSGRDLGLVPPIGQWKKLGGGFLLGFVSLAVVAGIVLAFGVRQFDGALTAGKIATKLLGAAATAAIVAVLEEILFRGAIFGAFKRVFNWKFAAVLSSMIYAIVHFLARTRLAGPVTWLSGLQLLPQMLAGFAEWHAIVPGFFNLTLAGLLLAWAYQRTGNLYFSIGLHAGWIFWLKSYGTVTRAAAGAANGWWGTDKLIDGWLATVVLAGVVMVMAGMRERGGKAT